MACERCVQRGKTWVGEDPKCAFPDGVFVSENWNCATACDLRTLADDQRKWSDEQYAATLPWEGAFVVLSWYKNRGRTEGAWLMREGKIDPLTLKDAEAFLVGAHRRDRD